MIHTAPPTVGYYCQRFEPNTFDPSHCSSCMQPDHMHLTSNTTAVAAAQQEGSEEWVCTVYKSFNSNEKQLFSWNNPLIGLLITIQTINILQVCIQYWPCEIHAMVLPLWYTHCLDSCAQSKSTNTIYLFIYVFCFLFFFGKYYMIQYGTDC